VTTSGDTPLSKTAWAIGHRKSRPVLALLVTLLMTTSMLVAIAVAGSANSETPAERCARETSAYNAAWVASWSAANPGSDPSQAPPPPVPYLCRDPGEAPTTTPTSPELVAPGIPTTAPETPTGPNVGAHAPTDIPSAGSVPIVPVPGMPDQVSDMQTGQGALDQGGRTTPGASGSTPPAERLGWKCSILNPAASLEGDLLNPTIYDYVWTLTPEQSRQIWDAGMDGAGYVGPAICTRFLGPAAGAGCVLIIRGVTELGRPAADEYFEITMGMKVRGPFVSVRKLKIEGPKDETTPSAPPLTTTMTTTNTSTTVPWTPPQTTQQWTPTQEVPNEQPEPPPPEPSITETKAPEKPPQMINCDAPNPPSKCNLV
jgi:hypothetical protein